MVTWLEKKIVEINMVKINLKAAVFVWVPHFGQQVDFQLKAASIW